MAFSEPQRKGTKLPTGYRRLVPMEVSWLQSIVVFGGSSLVFLTVSFILSLVIRLFISQQLAFAGFVVGGLVALNTGRLAHYRLLRGHLVKRGVFCTRYWLLLLRQLLLEYFVAFWLYISRSVLT